MIEGGTTGRRGTREEWGQGGGGVEVRQRIRGDKRCLG